MIRVCEFAMPGLEPAFKLASMSVSEAEAFVKQGNEMLAKVKEDPARVPREYWINRRNETVLASLKKALPDSWNADDWTPERFAQEFDLPTVEAMFNKILEFSGLKPPESAGEVAAAPALPTSDAA
jgi:hypothetical protein